MYLFGQEAKEKKKKSEATIVSMGTSHDVGKAQVHATTIIYRIEEDVPETRFFHERSRRSGTHCYVYTFVGGRVPLADGIVGRRGYNDLHLLINKSTPRNCT